MLLQERSVPPAEAGNLDAFIDQVDVELEQGIFPYIGGGYEVAIYEGEVSSPEGYIPPSPYTEGLSRGIFYVVKRDTPLRKHDIQHIVAMRRMMSVPGFGDMLKRAAQNAHVADDVSQAIFTGSVDKLGDLVLSEMFDGALSPTSGRIGLENIVLLSGSAERSEERRAVVLDIWTQLDMPEWY